MSVNEIKSKNNDKIVKGQFYIPSLIKGKVGKYKFLKLRIAPSTIKNAGMGCYAVDNIPKGARGCYRGVFKSLNSEKVDYLYSWEIFKFNKKGKTKYTGPIGYLDGSNDKYSNWSKYVNCSNNRSGNNMEPDQHYKKLYYIALRDIKEGEELFIDYGEGYRKDNLKMKGEY
jgi:hypothetical protein